MATLIELLNPTPTVDPDEARPGDEGWPLEVAG
jgi:hypothetical protein